MLALPLRGMPMRRLHGRVLVVTSLMLIVTSARGRPPAAPDDPLPPAARARLGSVRLWHGPGVTELVFAPDGKSVFSAADDAVVRACGRRRYRKEVSAPIPRPRGQRLLHRPAPRRPGAGDGGRGQDRPAVGRGHGPRDAHRWESRRSCAYGLASFRRTIRKLAYWQPVAVARETDRRFVGPGGGQGTPAVRLPRSGGLAKLSHGAWRAGFVGS